MDFRLIFTIYSIVFVSMLLITFGLKKKEKIVRNKLYICLIISALTYAVVELLGLCIMYLFPDFKFLDFFFF